jgi:hypothetical protein
MKKQIVLFLSILTLFIAQNLFGQGRNEFSQVPDEFAKQLGEYVLLSKRADVEKTYKDFSVRFKNLSEKETQRVTATCNTMIGLKMNAIPYFTDYMKSVVYAETANGSGSEFHQWHDVVDAMLNGIENRRFEPIRAFLGFSANFFEKNNFVFTDLGVNWYFDTKNYKFVHEKSGPSVVWEKLTLSAHFKKDSIQIFDTKGAFFPLTNQWKGNGGKVTWQRFGYGDTYCTLKEYSLDPTKGFYKAEKVLLHYPLMFPDRDLEGNFEDKLTVKNDKIEGSYPRFESYDKQLKISNLGGNIQYQGGFKLHGTTVFGYGTSTERARLTMNDTRRGNRNFRASAENFTIRKGENIVGERVESVIFFGKDSIFHPSLNLKIDIDKDELTLSRGQRGSDRNPFYNSYHKVYVDVGKIKWFVEKDSFIIGEKYPGFGINTNNAMFESLKYFSEADYQKFQNIATINPISNIKLYSDRVQKKVIPADEIARSINPKMDHTMIQSLLFDLVAQGFITYDVDKQMVELKEKIFHFAAANQKKEDHDVMRINSETKLENAVFSLRDTSIFTNGVNGVELSAKQRVRFVPRNKELVLKRNRDMDFDGQVYGGLGIFYGRNYHFNYDRFDIQTDSARYLDLYLRFGEDKATKQTPMAISSRLEHLKGVLLIDAPNNKSGRDDIKMFPSFQSKDNSYVFYDAPNIQDSVYKRDSFYFKLDKFNLEGMDSLVKNDLKFKGLMRSSNIFPEFRETLVVQQDTSLGFKTKSPPEGYALYKGKGDYTGDINLSNKGFLGTGVVKYLDASIESKDIVFHPNQMKASAKTFELKENRSRNVPQVIGPGVDINWKPYQDSMYMNARDSAFRFFKEGVHTLRSIIILTPGGVKGKGTFDWDKGTLQSQLFSFGSHSVSSDSMNMSIRALDKDKSATDQLAFDTKNIRGKIDFDEQMGRFKANSDDIQTYMPGVKYKTSINEFDWDLKKEEIAFKSDGQEATFLCVDAEQDSLNYLGMRAGYDLKSNILKVGGVPYVLTCDAYVYPKDENVQVELGGKMTTLTDARIVCDTITKHHVINRATVNIKGRKLYEAVGFYEYNVAGKEQEIKFDNIVGQRVGKGQRSEKRTETRATGEITGEKEFKIDYKTTFKGKISLFSNTKNLQFEGFAKLQMENLPNQQWFSINCFADKKDLAILYNVPKNEVGEPLYTGIYISKENSAAYPRAMMPLSFRKDRSIIDVKGLFKYNQKGDELIFGDSSKIISGSPSGNRLTFNNKTNIVNAEGKLNLGAGLQYITVKAAGRAKTSFLKPDEVQVDSSGIRANPTTIEAMVGIDMRVPEKILKIMANNISVGGNDDLDSDYLKDDFIEKTMSEFIPNKEEYFKVLNVLKNKTLEMPDKLNKYNFLFSRLPMRWNAETQSFISNTKKPDLNSVAGIKVNKQTAAFVEFRMPSNEDDRVYVYIKTGNDFFYFFGYQKGMLSITSNDQEIEKEFKKIKPKERITKMPDGQPFEMQWVENATAELFLRRVTNAQK